MRVLVIGVVFNVAVAVSGNDANCSLRVFLAFAAPLSFAAKKSNESETARAQW